jgi:ATP-binding cassette subfamily C protein LapB
LSAGQKQRVNLARGVLLDRSLYLLDEPTSHLDEATEKAVVAAIKKYLGNKTMVIVTHRPAIKKICNKFYKMIHHTVSPE